MPSPYETSGFLGGQMPAMGAPGAIGGSPESLQAGYTNAYNTALGANTALYQNILSGYQNVAAGQRSAQDALAAGYQTLGGRLDSRLADAAGASRAGYAGLDDTAAWMGGTLGEMYGRQADVDARYADLRAGAAAGYGGLQSGTVSAFRDLRRDAATGYGRMRDDLGGAYGSLLNETLGEVAGLGRERGHQIDEDYALASGRSQNRLAERGLANSTVAETVQRGVDFDRSRSRNELAERMAALRGGFRERIGGAGLAAGERAGYAGMAADLAFGREGVAAGERLGAAGLGTDVGLAQAGLGFRERAGAAQADQANRQTLARMGAREGGVRSADDYARLAASYGAQVGMAGLGQQARNVDANTALAQDQLRWMNSISAPYPDAGAYAQLAQMAGAGRGRGDGRQNMFDFNGSPEGMVRTASSGGRVPDSRGYVGSGVRGSGGGGGGVFSAFTPGGFSVGMGGGNPTASYEQNNPYAPVYEGGGYQYQPPEGEYEMTPEDLYGLTGEQYQLSPEELYGLTGEVPPQDVLFGGYGDY